MKILPFIILTFLIISCSSQKETQYKKAKSSNDIEVLKGFIRKYPDHEEIDRIIYRLRLFEYEKSKESKSVMLWRYFIEKYIQGSDVDDIKNIYFKKDFEKAGNSLKKLKLLKAKFTEERFHKEINKKLYALESKNILSENNPNILKKFQKYYPNSNINDEINKKLLKIELNNLIKEKNIYKINKFLTINPSFKNKDINKKIEEITFDKYKETDIKNLKSFLENNKDFKRYNELENIFIEKSYEEKIAYFDYDALIKLDKKYKNIKYKNDVKWFKNNKNKVKKAYNLIKIINAPIENNNKISELFELGNSIKKEAQIIQTMFYITNNLSSYLRKLDSFFILIQLSTLKSLEAFLNSDLKNNEKLLYDKIKELKIRKSKNYESQIIALYFILNEFDKFKESLKLIQNTKDLWLNFLKYYYENISLEEFIELMDIRIQESLKMIKSPNSIMKNKIDRKIDLYYVDRILVYILAQKKKMSLKTIDKINKIKQNLKNIEKFTSFIEFKKYENDIINSFKKLVKIKKPSKILLKNILLKNPILKLKKIISKIPLYKKFNSLKCLDKSKECLKKEQLFNIFN